MLAWGCSVPSGVTRGYAGCDVPASAKKDVVAIAAGGDEDLALKKDGSVVAWGPLGSPPASMRRGIIAIAAGTYHIVVLKRDGGVVAWGCSAESVVESMCEVPASANKGVIAVAAGVWHSLALNVGR